MMNKISSTKIFYESGIHSFIYDNGQMLSDIFGGYDKYHNKLLPYRIICRAAARMITSEYEGGIDNERFL
jgi:hypothetical protein